MLVRARSLADKAAAFGAADRGFESHRARLLFKIRFWKHPPFFGMCRFCPYWVLDVGVFHGFFQICFYDVKIDARCFYVGMAEQFLNDPYIYTCPKQVCGVVMAEAVSMKPGQACFSCCCLNHGTEAGGREAA